MLKDNDHDDEGDTVDDGEDDLGSDDDSDDEVDYDWRCLCMHDSDVIERRSVISIDDDDGVVVLGCDGGMNKQKLARRGDMMCLMWVGVDGDDEMMPID